MKCNKCSSNRAVKNGKKNGHQYYKCKECGVNFCEEVKGSMQSQRQAIVLYCFGLSLRTIGTILGFSNVSILYWVRDFAKTHYHKPIPKGDIVLELDEMWHFIEKKKLNCGFGRHIVAQLDSLLTGNVEIVIPPLLKYCIID